ncbi:alpha/beta hydrolase [Embleya hyalina]|uniref:Alpha/beta hydrolase n=1 Tax=Embleya hyalina TaxID=516124 RepID=A0A401Z6X5_9ACTN|nr:alpha/beta fold hydrolase [Embleya hyalina]GCE02604.1 alpha/beta hydrolase [Embleya hyalina]
MRHDVEFAGAHAVPLRGWLYLPERARRPVPGVVMTHGFSCTRGMGLEGFARAFAAAGLGVLLYDHRNFGDSGGEPRGRINLFAQARDYRYALDRLADHARIDAGRLAVWGSSLSAAAALTVAAVDDRVKAVVANVPFAAHRDVDYADHALAGARFAEMRRALDRDTQGRPRPDTAADIDAPLAGPRPVVALDGPDDEAFMPAAEATAWFKQYADRPETGWTNRYTWCPAGMDRLFDPGAALPHLGDTPVLMTVALDDRIIAKDVTLAAYQRLRGPKPLELLDGDHFSTYDNAPAFTRTCTAMCDFLTETLR